MNKVRKLACRLRNQFQKLQQQPSKVKQTPKELRHGEKKYFQIEWKTQENKEEEKKKVGNIHRGNSAFQ